MNINDTGLALQTFNTILTNNIAQMQKTLGSGYTLRPEGVLDNFIVILAFWEYYIERQIAYLTKQFDPKTADGEYQDALYERIALYREKAVPTTFTLNLTGIANTEIPEDNIEIKNDEGDVFMNSGFTFDENGVALVCFKSLLNDNISVSKYDKFTVVRKPYNVEFVDLSTIDNILNGHSTESDNKFRSRFYSLQTRPTKCTRNAIIKNLSEYTEGMTFVIVQDCNSDTNIPAGSIKIIAKPIVSDTEFGKAILDNVICGLNFIGDTEVDVPLSNGQSWSVRYQKAKETEIEIKATVKIRKSYYQNYVLKIIQDNIISYFKSQQYGLKASVFATDFVLPILETDGVEAVTEIAIKQSIDETYSESIILEQDIYPILTEENVHLTSAII